MVISATGEAHVHGEEFGSPKNILWVYWIKYHQNGILYLSVYLVC